MEHEVEIFSAGKFFAEDLARFGGHPVIHRAERLRSKDGSEDVQFCAAADSTVKYYTIRKVNGQTVDAVLVVLAPDKRSKGGH